MARHVFSEHAKGVVIKAYYLESQTTSKMAFYEKELPEIWKQRVENEPFPSFSSVNQWIIKAESVQNVADFSLSTEVNNPIPEPTVANDHVQHNHLSLSKEDQSEQPAQPNEPIISVIGLPELNCSNQSTQTSVDAPPQINSAANQPHRANSSSRDKPATTITKRLDIPNPPVEHLTLLTPLCFLLAASISAVRLILLWLGTCQQAIGSRLIKLAKCL